MASAARGSTSSARRYACSAPLASPMARRAFPRFVEYDALFGSIAAARSNSFKASCGRFRSAASRPRPLCATALFGREHQRGPIRANRLVDQSAGGRARRLARRLARGDREIVQEQRVGRPALRRAPVDLERARRLAAFPERACVSGLKDRRIRIGGGQRRQGGRGRCDLARIERRERVLELDSTRRSSRPDSVHRLQATAGPSWRRSRANAGVARRRTKSRGRPAWRRAAGSRRCARPSPRSPTAARPTTSRSSRGSLCRS